MIRQIFFIAVRVDLPEGRFTEPVLWICAVAAPGGFACGYSQLVADDPGKDRFAIVVGVNVGGILFQGKAKIHGEDIPGLSAVIRMDVHGKGKVSVGVSPDVQLHPVCGAVFLKIKYLHVGVLLKLCYCLAAFPDMHGQKGILSACLQRDPFSILQDTAVDVVIKLRCLRRGVKAFI